MHFTEPLISAHDIVCLTFLSCLVIFLYILHASHLCHIHKADHGLYLDISFIYKFQLIIYLFIYMELECKPRNSLKILTLLYENNRSSHLKF